MKVYAVFADTYLPEVYDSNVILVGIYESVKLARSVADKLYNETEYEVWVENVILNNTVMYSLV